MSKELEKKAHSFFHDEIMTQHWLETPSSLFHNKTPSEHFLSSEEGRRDVLAYLDLLLSPQSK